jgi:hypothetical protein
MGGAGDIILIKKNTTKIVRTYDRTGKYMNLSPNGSKKGRRRRRRIAPTRRIRRDKKRRIRREGKGKVKGETRTSYFIASVVQWIEKKPLTWASQV